MNVLEFMTTDIGGTLVFPFAAAIHASLVLLSVVRIRHYHYDWWWWMLPTYCTFMAIGFGIFSLGLGPGNLVDDMVTRAFGRMAWLLSTFSMFIFVVMYMRQEMHAQRK